MKTLGLRHVALNVEDPQRSKQFYCDVLNMDLEWEPDADNVYLTSQGQDNLAIHKGEPPISKRGALDHLGFIIRSIDEVDDWYAEIKTKLPTYNCKILKEIKTHRDGARSFYFNDPDGNVLQLMYHPPISK